jgi:hypothetical protein
MVSGLDRRVCIAHVAALFALTVAAVPARADNAKWARDCAEWIDKKGYSVDYIEQRTGQRPTGTMARDWRPNLEPKDAGPDDVVFLRVESADHQGQRVEVVDEVVKSADGSVRAFRTSSMNIGKLVEPKCHITENFGKVRKRTVAFDRVIGAWRPERK